MARIKQIYEIRKDYLENWIGFFRAHHRRAKAEAYIKIARDIGVPLDAEEIDRMELIHHSHQLELFTDYDSQASTPV